MLYTGKQIVSRIRAHVRKRGGVYGVWFVGVCKHARRRLFVSHGVREKDDCWIYAHAESSGVASKVRSYFVKKLGATGSKIGAAADRDFVYAYRKNEHTKP